VSICAQLGQAEQDTVACNRASSHIEWGPFRRHLATCVRSPNHATRSRRVLFEEKSLAGSLDSHQRLEAASDQTLSIASEQMPRKRLETGTVQLANCPGSPRLQAVLSRAFDLQPRRHLFCTVHHPPEDEDDELLELFFEDDEFELR